MGATYPKEAEGMKKIVPFAIKLIPGVGLQGAGPDDAVVSVNEDGFGIMVNNARQVDYAYHQIAKMQTKYDPREYVIASAEAAKQTKDALNASVKKKLGFLPWEKAPEAIEAGVQKGG
jgi:orotidine-5'-phosphate decarboxylase